MINLEPSLLCLRGDVTSNWITFNPILTLNEPAIEIFNDGNVKMKIGNGVDNFLDLPYLNEADNVNPDWNSTGGLSEILNKPTTVSGYGLSDVYTINEVDFKILTIQEASNSTNGFMSINDFIKLSGISSGATKNDTDQNLKNRQNHTGTQLSNTISDFVKSVNDSQLSEIYIDNTDVTSGDTVCSSINKLQSQNSNIKSNLSSHVNNVNNPHGVTKHQIDLGSVDNTSDVNKPISISTQNALNLKVDKTTSIVAGSGLTGGGALDTNKTIDVGATDDSIIVGENGIKVDTQDILTSTSTTKPLSANQGKTLQDNKADKTTNIIAGSGLTGGGDLSSSKTINVVSANDAITVNADNIQLNTIDNLTTISTTKPLSANQGKILNDKATQIETENSNIKSNLSSHVNNVNNPHGVTKHQIDLGSVDNTSDMNKPISISTQNALNLKVDKTTSIVAGSGLTGGGILSGNTTINVVSLNDGILVNNDNIELKTINDLTTISTTKPLSANQGKILNDKYSQLETDLNIKNAEQDASIKSIEQLLSQSNMNQTAQVSSSGREIVSLPKTASNGGMDIKLEGSTAQNLVANGDFRNGTTGWNRVTITNGVAVNTILSDNLLNNYSSAIYSYFQFFNNKKYYFKTKARVTYAGAQSIQLHRNLGQPTNTTFVTNPVQNQWYQHSEIKQATADLSGPIAVLHTFPNDSALLGKTMEIAYLFVIDLTATFGAGNEPDLATCNAMFSTYFEGTKSFIPTGRVRSRVGINMFNPSDFVKNGISKGLSSDYIKLSGNGIFNKYISYVEKYFDYLKGCFEPNTQYTLKATGKISNYYDSRVNVKLQFTYTDMSIQSILFSPTESTVSMTSQSGKTISHVGLSSWGYTGDVTIWDISLTKGSTQGPYEPYKSTKLYLTAPDLRSNGNVKDEIRKGANGYEHVKRVGVGTLGVNGIAGGDFENGLVGAIGLGEEVATWSLNNSSPISGTQDGRLIVSSAGTSDVRPLLLFNNNRTVGQLRRFSCSYKINSGTILSIQFNKGSSSLFIPFFGTSGSMTAYYICEGNLANYLYFNGKNTFDLQLDKIKDELVNVADGLPSNSTITEFGTDIYYTLATPIITPIEHAGILNSTESGTVFHEPVVADAGIYGVNLTVLNTAYPISSLEEIMVHTNVDTYLDASKAVIASDGLSFTHPDLRAGDLVLYTYFFNKEKVNGLITATYYDGRYVIADTANGKFYKWGVKSTNGVATIQLTEV